MKFIATCKMGLESTVGAELEKLGINVEKKEDARVTFTGSFYDMAKACIWLRCAERVLFVVGEFEATTFTELFDNTIETKLSQYFQRDSIIHVNGKSAKSTLFSVSDCQSIVKKAIVENLKKSFKTNILPENGNRVIIEVGILKDKVTLALDACGAGLSRRGYRLHNYEAPIAETLGAAIVMLSRYHADIPLIDPMCGSGTMPIEAAMIAQNIAPGKLRDFAAEEWHFIEKGMFNYLRREADEAVLHNKIDITGCDIDSRAIYLSKQHAKNAGVMINWNVAPISELVSSKERGIIVCNPPYGERMMKKSEVEKIYREMRTVFDELPPAWTKHIITSMPDFERVYAKRADKRRNLSNGGMKCTLYSYFRSDEQ